FPEVPDLTERARLMPTKIHAAKEAPAKATPVFHIAASGSSGGQVSPVPKLLTQLPLLWSKRILDKILSWPHL
ncbi:hypothetical protein M9458_029625, partial [Cirrhinus mrigala]